MEKYKKLEKIGVGTYATVYRAMDIKEKSFVALKEITVNPNEGAPSTALREVAFMKELDHPNIVQLLEVIHTESQLVLVFECLDQDLKQYMDAKRSSNQSLESKGIKKLLYSLLHGVNYCHERQIMHRDLKPQNLLLNHHGNLKVADFGLARSFGIPVANFSHEVVTLWYRPPEVLLGATNYSTAVDMWSIGCIMAEMYLMGSPIFPGKDAPHQLNCIFKLLGSPSSEEWAHLLSTHRILPEWARSIPFYGKPSSLANLFPMIDPQGIDLLRRLLDLRPMYRISAFEALKHPFFDDLKLGVAKCRYDGKDNFYNVPEQNNNDSGSISR